MCAAAVLADVGPLPCLPRTPPAPMVTAGLRTGTCGPACPIWGFSQNQQELKWDPGFFFLGRGPEPAAMSHHQVL